MPEAEMPEKPNLQFVIFLPVFVTFAFFQPSKFGQISEQKFPRSHITHERGRIANTLNIKVFDGFPIKTEQKNRKNEH
jgi:hypothetical protein